MSVVQEHCGISMAIKKRLGIKSILCMHAGLISEYIVRN